MFENLRRKSLSKQYVDLDTHFFFKQGHAMYMGMSAINKHHQRFQSQGKKIKGSFDDSYAMVGNYYQVKEIFGSGSDFSGGNKFNMNFCPKGSYILRKDDGTPIKTVLVEPFLLGESEVTQGLYLDIMGSNPSNKDSVGSKSATQYPVENVTWYEAIEFCNQLSDVQGFDKCYTLKNVVSENIPYDPGKPLKPRTRTKSAEVLWDRTKNGYRLPEIDEWIWAAKAGTESTWSGTDDETKLKDYAWFWDNSNQSIQSVKKRKPNEWGFYDMSGNVDEWCWDSKQITNPITNETKEVKNIRGGSVTSTPRGSKISRSQSQSPDHKESYLGFRIARTPYISDVALSVSFFGKAW